AGKAFHQLSALSASSFTQRAKTLVEARFAGLAPSSACACARAQLAAAFGSVRAQEEASSAARLSRRAGGSLSQFASKFAHSSGVMDFVPRFVASEAML